MIPEILNFPVCVDFVLTFILNYKFKDATNKTILIISRGVCVFAHVCNFSNFHDPKMLIVTSVYVAALLLIYCYSL